MENYANAGSPVWLQLVAVHPANACNSSHCAEHADWQHRELNCVPR
jgi:hypothetical protein